MGFVHTSGRRLTFAVVSAGCLAAAGEPIHVRQPQGVSRGFLVVRSESGSVLAHGESIQTVEGDRLVSRLIFSFRDGSLDDETTIFTQHGEFRLVSDHHIQRGPFFAKGCDLLVEADGQVTSRSVDKEGREKVEVNHVDLPDDVYNGLVGTALSNIRPNAPEFKLSLVAAVGKGRLIKLDIAPDGKGSFLLSGVRRTASIFRIKTELGGVVGAVAPIVGKQPADIFVWVLGGAAPVVVRGLTQLSVDGPVVSIEIVGGTFPRFTSPK